MCSSGQEFVVPALQTKCLEAICLRVKICEDRECENLCVYMCGGWGWVEERERERKEANVTYRKLGDRRHIYKLYVLSVLQESSKVILSRHVLV